jgi:hypothetical protein
VGALAAERSNHVRACRGVALSLPKERSRDKKRSLFLVTAKLPKADEAGPKTAKRKRCPARNEGEIAGLGLKKRLIAKSLQNNRQFVYYLVRGFPAAISMGLFGVAKC